MTTKRQKSGGAVTRARQHPPIEEGYFCSGLAEPIQELVHSSAIMGEGFERRISQTLPEETAHNTAALHLHMAYAVKLFKRLARGQRKPEVKATLRFLTELREEFGIVARNAQDALQRAKGVRHGAWQSVREKSIALMRDLQSRLDTLCYYVEPDKTIKDGTRTKKQAIDAVNDMHDGITALMEQLGVSSADIEGVRHG